MILRDRNIATVLACLSVFTGGMGWHKFYLGRIGSGLLYFFFVWTFIPLALSVADVILLLGMEQREFELVYNHRSTDKLDHLRVDVQSLAEHPRQNFSRESSASKARELKELRQLLVEGAISETDYEQLKNEIIRR